MLIYQTISTIKDAALHYPGSAGVASKVLLKKFQLIVYASFEVFPVINIEVTDGIIYRLCIAGFLKTHGIRFQP